MTLNKATEAIVKAEKVLAECKCTDRMAASHWLSISATWQPHSAVPARRSAIVTKVY